MQTYYFVILDGDTLRIIEHTAQPEVLEHGLNYRSVYIPGWSIFKTRSEAEKLRDSLAEDTGANADL